METPEGLPIECPELGQEGIQIYLLGVTNQQMGKIKLLKLRIQLNESSFWTRSPVVDGASNGSQMLGRVISERRADSSIVVYIALVAVEGEYQ